MSCMSTHCQGGTEYICIVHYNSWISLKSMSMLIRFWCGTRLNKHIHTQIVHFATFDNNRIEQLHCDFEVILCVPIKNNSKWTNKWRKLNSNILPIWNAQCRQKHTRAFVFVVIMCSPLNMLSSCKKKKEKKYRYNKWHQPNKQSNEYTNNRPTNKPALTLNRNKATQE